MNFEFSPKTYGVASATERNFMFGFKTLGNVKLKHHKNTHGIQAVPASAPSEVLLPMLQHIGSPAVPTVKVGDTVKIGQKIGEADGFVSSPVYASISGTVKKIDDYLTADGRRIPAVLIENDYKNELSEEVKAPEVSDLDSLVEAVRASGIVGLGGAGFPTAVKLAGVKDCPIDTVVINGSECEPYITTDTRIMIDRAEAIYRGIALLKSCLDGVKSYVIGIESNKPDCIAKMNEMFVDSSDVRVHTLPSLYPQGAEKVIIYNSTGRVVPEGKLPKDVGVLVINVSTLVAIVDYIDTGMPLVNRLVTVDGSAVKEPKNLILPIGTRLSHILGEVELKGEVGKILFGGPMMGTPACSPDDPMTKTTGAVTVLDRKDSREPKSTACIHCGRCAESCPLSLNPYMYSKILGLEHAEDRIAMLKEYSVSLCMECGCCSYVCPAKRPLVQNNRLAKSTLREYCERKSTLKD